MQQFLDSLSLPTLLTLGRGLPLVAGAILLGVGAAYCFFGRRIFRLLIVGVGAAAGWELGRITGVHFGITPMYIALPVSLVLAGLAWPAWQIGVFVLGGGVGAVIGAEGLSGAAGDREMVLWGAVAGFVLGGLLAVMLIKVMSVALTAVVGAFLVYTGLVAILPFLQGLPGRPLVSLSLIGIVALAGMVAQLAQGDPEENRTRRAKEKEERQKARDDAEQKERWAKYLE
ncbi:MAG: hypothetical protein P1V51_11850 [Deltaproteobacteria bacterium]|nr:hypothetical protein [Deltaproteobacteria bacterium]